MKISAIHVSLSSSKRRRSCGTRGRLRHCKHRHSQQKNGTELDHLRRTRLSYDFAGSKARKQSVYNGYVSWVLKTPRKTPSAPLLQSTFPAVTSTCIRLVLLTSSILVTI